MNARHRPWRPSIWTWLPIWSALALMMLHPGCSCDDDPVDPGDTPYDAGNPYGLAAFAGVDRWVHQGDEVALLGIGTGEAVELAWDLDGDGTFETDVEVGEIVDHPFEEVGTHEVAFRATSAAGESAEDAIFVHVYSADESIRVHDFGPYFVFDEEPPAVVTPASGSFEDAWNQSEYQGIGETQQAKLDADGFAVTETGYDQMFLLYQGIDSSWSDRYPYITVDSVLHAFHILYDYSLRVAEDRVLIGELQDLTGAMVDHFYLLLEQAPTGELAEAIELDLAFYSLLAVLLDPEFAVPMEVTDTVGAELASIEAAAGLEESALWPGLKEDFSQYVPRGHYDRTEELGRYFKAMMYAGRMTFHLAYPEREDENRVETIAALLQVQAMRQVSADGRVAIDYWDSIYEPTAFFVGKMDELTQYEYAELAAEVYGADLGLLDPAELAEDPLLTDFMERGIEELRDPQITSELIPVAAWENDIAKGYRFMGQRYVPDSYIFEQLVWSEVGTHPDDKRGMPRGLDVFAVMGSERAYQILDEVYDETHYENYEEQHAALAEQFEQITDEEWSQNVYWGWMYALEPMLRGESNGGDLLGRSVEWFDRMLDGALGSWAELRHDTILYAEQSYTDDDAADDDDDDDPPVEFHGYVDPVPQTWARLASLSRMLREGLTARGLDDPDICSKLASIEERCLVFRDMAIQELLDQPLDPDEASVFYSYGSWLENVSKVELPELSDPLVDEDMAVIADVHTDPRAGIEEVLEVGVGHPLRMYVLLDYQGTTFVTEGAIFAYHEFTWPMDDRLTDGEWQEMLDAGTAPAMPDWIFD